MTIKIIFYIIYLLTCAGIGLFCGANDWHITSWQNWYLIGSIILAFVCGGIVI